MYGYVDFGLSAVENALSNITDNEKGIKGSVEKDVVEYFLHSAKAYSIRKSIDGTLKKDVTVKDICHCSSSVSAYRPSCNVVDDLMRSNSDGGVQYSSTISYLAL
jgi:hypothetical protein